MFPLLVVLRGCEMAGCRTRLVTAVVVDPSYRSDLETALAVLILLGTGALVGIWLRPRVLHFQGRMVMMMSNLFLLEPLYYLLNGSLIQPWSSLIRTPLNGSSAH